MDPIAFWTLVFTIIGAVAAVAAALFGAWALYYAKRGPSKEDIERVERNTAQTAEHIDAVREHSAATEGHLAQQRRRETLLALVNRVSVSVNAGGPTAEPLLLRFILTDADVELLSIDLINSDKMVFGSFPCASSEPSHFEVTIPSDAIQRWFHASANNVNGRRAQLRLHLRLGNQEADRTLSADMGQVSQQKTPGVQTWETVWVLEGAC